MQFRVTGKTRDFFADIDAQQDPNYKFDYFLENDKGSVLITVHDHPKCKRDESLVSGKKYKIRLSPRMTVTGGQPYPVCLRLAIAKEMKPKAPKDDEPTSGADFLKN